MGGTKIKVGPTYCIVGGGAKDCILVKMKQWEWKGVYNFLTWSGGRGGGGLKINHKSFTFFRLVILNIILEKTEKRLLFIEIVAILNILYVTIFWKHNLKKILNTSTFLIYTTFTVVILDLLTIILEKNLKKLFSFHRNGGHFEYLIRSCDYFFGQN